jgi:hypothetical protein
VWRKNSPFPPVVVVKHSNGGTELWTGSVQLVQRLATVCSTGVPFVYWGRDLFLSLSPRPDMRYIQPIQWLSGRFTRKSSGISWPFPSIYYRGQWWSYASTPWNICMVWCLIKHKGNFTLPFKARFTLGSGSRVSVWLGSRVSRWLDRL